MIPRIAQQPARPGVFRPALLLETVPWLMLAAALRVVTVRTITQKDGAVQREVVAIDTYH